MLKLVGKLILKLLGFEFISKYSPMMQNSIIIEAPHTSMWDFVIGRAGLWILGIRCSFLIKKELFFFPLGLILKSLGAVPVDRGHDKKDFFNKIINRLKTDKRFSLIITPEGTRKYTKTWKKGYYNFALLSQRPIFMAWIDYDKKKCGVSSDTMLIPSGNYSQDYEKIKSFYKDIRAKHPENFNLSQEYRQDKQ